MKKKFNSINLAIFATVIMSVFASCGDSEVFDEPVMFRTRAMGRMTQSIEPSQPYITTGGTETLDPHEIASGLYITVTLTWEKGFCSFYPIDASFVISGATDIFEATTPPDFVKNGGCNAFYISDNLNDFVATHIKGIYREVKWTGQEFDTIHHFLDEVFKAQKALEIQERLLSDPERSPSAFPLSLDSLTVQKQ